MHRQPLVPTPSKSSCGCVDGVRSCDEEEESDSFDGEVELCAGYKANVNRRHKCEVLRTCNIFDLRKLPHNH